MTGPELRKAIEKSNNMAYKSKFTDPRYRGMNRGLYRPQIQYSMKLFRRVAEKAWLVNTIVGHIIDKVMPYMRPESARGSRFFAIELKDEDKKMSDADKKRALEIQEFFLKTGWPDIKKYPDIGKFHNDDLIHYTKKILRDLLTLDQVAAEKIHRQNGDLFAFEAIDAATVVRASEEGYQGDDEIRYVQMIDSQVTAQYADNEIIFQFQNPRTDIRFYGYGYSKIEQAIDLIVSLINSFNYNAGAFTDDKLPRGMLLLNGDVGFEEVEEIEDYLIDVMGPGGLNSALGKWGIPIIPSGKSGDKTSITWQSLNQSNQDMQFSRWQDTLYMSIGALFGIDIESVGIKSEKGAKIIESGSAEAHKYSDDKGIGNALTFLERHFQNILDEVDDRFRFVFHGFEQDDAKDQRDATEMELKTYRSMNEIRRENDLDEYDADWANVPGAQNPQILQAYMASKGMSSGDQQPEQPGSQQESGDEWGDFGKSLPDQIVIRI